MSRGEEWAEELSEMAAEHHGRTPSPGGYVVPGPGAKPTRFEFLFEGFQAALEFDDRPLLGEEKAHDEAIRAETDRAIERIRVALGLPEGLIGSAHDVGEDVSFG